MYWLKDQGKNPYRFSFFICKLWTKFGIFSKIQTPSLPWYLNTWSSNKTHWIFTKDGLSSLTCWIKLDFIIFKRLKLLWNGIVLLFGSEVLGKEFIEFYQLLLLFNLLNLYDDSLSEEVNWVFSKIKLSYYNLVSSE